MTSSSPEGEQTVATTVLVVEHEVLIRMVIAEYLRECRYRVLEAASGEEAMLVLDQPEIVVDIVMSDVEMPGSIDGFGLSTWIRQNRQGTQVLLIGSAAKAAEAAANLCEAGSFFAKPYDAKAVVDRIRQLLGRRASRPVRE